MKKNKLKDYGVLIALVLFSVGITIFSPQFATKRNILNLLRQSSIIGIIATGMTFVIISGNFDISVGAVAALSGSIVLKLVSLDLPLIVAILAAVLVSMLIGIINGLAVAKFKIPSLIATMGTVGIIKGTMLLLTGGYPITMKVPELDYLGNGHVFGIPVPILIYLFVVVICYLVLTKTKFGRHVYAVGGNEEASKLNGVEVEKQKVKVFMINAFLATLAGIILVGRMGTASPVAGEGYDMDAISSVVIGGTSVSGGSGSVLNTVLGVLLMGVINNSFNLLGVHMYFQYIFKGLIILIAVGLDSYNKRGSN